MCKHTQLKKNNYLYFQRSITNLFVEYWIVSNETNTDVRMYNLFIR